jgi:hypothetical protein
MTPFLISLLFVFITVGILRGFGPATWLAIRTGRMPGIGRPYTRRDTPCRFFFVVLGSIGFIVSSIGMTSFVLFMSFRDFLGWEM